MSEPIGPERRRVLTGLGAVAAGGVGATIWRSARSAPGGGSTVAGTESNASLPDVEVSDRERLLRRLRRATFGVDAATLASVDELGWSGWLDRQLDPDATDDAAVEAMVEGYATLSMPAAERRDLAKDDEAGRRRVGFELRHAALVRACHSEAQLREVLVDHWNNHFNTDSTEMIVAVTKGDEDAAFRTLATAPFAELLLASATSPSMLAYLDNARSRTPSPNENYGRELLELHTVGVDGGYDEADVADAARVFTGWSIDRSTLQFTFRHAWHDTGSKAVLGWETPGVSGPDGVDEGRSLLAHLAARPETAANVTTRLARRLVADDPAAVVVDAGVAAWEAGGGVIDAVVRALLSPEVFDSNHGPKVSRPFEAMATMVRRLGASVPADLSGAAAREAAVAMHERLDELGQPLLRAPSPTGYPDTTGAWTSTHGVSARWDLSAHLVRNADLFGIDLEALSGGANTVGEACARIAAGLWLEEPGPEDIADLVAATGRSAAERLDAATAAGVTSLALAARVAHER